MEGAVCFHELAVVLGTRDPVITVGDVELAGVVKEELSL